MKSKNSLLLLATLGLTVLSPAISQAAPFQNLDFEQAFSGPPYNGTPPSNSTPDGIPGGGVPGTAALPHWNWHGVQGTTTNISYNDILLDGPDIGLWHGTTQPYYGVASVLDGQYSLMLSDYNDYSPLFGTPNDVSISQTGTVPSNAMSVHFTIAIAGFVEYSQQPLSQMSDQDIINNFIQLSLGGIPLTLVRTSLIDGSPSYGQFEVAADVSSFAGQDALLKLLVAPNRNFVVDEEVQIDDIYFSPVPVPEPSSFALSAAGALGLATFARRMRKA